jgi:hypothetical protein
VQVEELLETPKVLLVQVVSVVQVEQTVVYTQEALEKVMVAHSVVVAVLTKMIRPQKAEQVVLELLGLYGDLAELIHQRIRVTSK